MSRMRFPAARFAAVAPAMLAGALISMSPGGAQAGCTDFASPGVDWKGCNMSDQEFVEMDLSGARLRNGRFFGANFTGTDLSKSDSRGAKFIDATMINVNFDEARLVKADLTKADLTGASLKGADLRRAELFRAVLRNAVLTGARLQGADLSAADLSGALWVDGKTTCAEGSIGQCNRQPTVTPKKSS